jgi:hypothetical protein
MKYHQSFIIRANYNSFIRALVVSTFLQNSPIYLPEGLDLSYLKRICTPYIAFISSSLGWVMANYLNHFILFI